MQRSGISRYWREWDDPRLVVLVLNNRDLNMVTWEQRVLSGDPKFTGSQDLPDFPYASYAESLGLEGVRMERPEDVARGWSAAFAARRPVVVEARVDPSTPPLPPHISLEQAKSFALSVARGDPDRRAYVKQAMQELMD